MAQSSSKPVKKYGFVASGGGYRSFYTGGALVWLKQNDIPVVHITSTSSGNNIVLDYLLWDWEAEELPPTLARTVRLNFKDIFSVITNFTGLKPSFISNGTHLFTVNKDKCRKSLQLDDPARRRNLAKNLKQLRWEILATNLSRRESEAFSVNEILQNINEANLDRFMDAFLAGITTIPYFKAISIGGDYYIEGGYMDNTPLRTIFEDPEVDEIVAVDFTDYDYQNALHKMYESHAFTLPLNSIDMNLLVSDLELTLPNIKIFSQARLINDMLEAVGKKSLKIGERTYYHKPLHVLRPKNLESMTVSLKHTAIQKEYFELGQQEMAALL